MSMRNLAPDEVDTGLLIHGALKRCPFDSGTPVTFAQVNDKTGVYRAVVSCSKCQAQMGFNAHSKDEAMHGVIAKWEARVPA